QNEPVKREPDASYLRSRGFGWEPLPWSRNEVEGIGRLIGKSAKIRIGREATEEIAKQTSKNYSILHFAVHGWLDDQIGLNSALVLSQPDALGKALTSEDNGLLQAWEIF